MSLTIPSSIHQPSPIKSINHQHPEEDQVISDPMDKKDFDRYRFRKFIPLSVVDGYIHEEVERSDRPTNVSYNQKGKTKKTK